MSARALRGIHASDFTLDQPVHGLTGVPSRLRDVVINSRFRAAERVFGSAISRSADVVVLAGGLLSPESGVGSRGPWFLREQFQHLASHGIEVIWAEDGSAVHDWVRRFVDLPSNVTMLSDGQFRDLTIRDQAVRVQCSTTSAGRPGTRSSSKWNIVVAPGLAVDPAVGTWADYVALAGPKRNSLLVDAHASGSPQGTGFHEPGVHGCLMFSLQRERRLETEFIPTDAVRWIEEPIAIRQDDDFESIRSRLSHRLRDFPPGHSCDAWIIRWTLAGRGDAWLNLLRADVVETLLTDLQREAGESELTVWPARICSDPDDVQVQSWQNGREGLAAVMRSLDEAAPLHGSHFDVSLLTEGEDASDLLRNLTPTYYEHSLKPRIRSHAARILARRSSAARP
jgi:exonuclease SbcD